MDVSDAQRHHRVMLERLREMGLEAEPIPGGQACTVLLQLGPEPFHFPDGARPVKQVRFATVGAHRIKCLEPAFFHLPMLSILQCSEAREVEEKIRAAWNSQLNRVRRSRERLSALDIASETEADGALLSFDVGLDDALARARAVDFAQIVLPGRGPMSGHAAASADERLVKPEDSVASGLDLQMALTTQLERMTREARRREAALQAEITREKARPEQRIENRAQRVLLVGPQLAADNALSNSLQMRGHEVVTAHNDAEAMEMFLRHSFELMLVDARLGRCDGLELVLAIQTLAGVERLPVVIVDDRNRSSARDKAKEIGAVGYLVRPIDAAKVAPGLEKLIQEPQYRRYSRYARRLAVRCGDAGMGGFTAGLSRVGMFVCTAFESRQKSIESYEIHLAESGKSIRVQGETIYRGAAKDDRAGGIGVRFHSFGEGDEALLIDYLRMLEGEAEDPS